MKKIILATLILYFFISRSWADATYTSDSESLLHIPYVRYQDQFYQARLSYLPPDKLRLDSTMPVQATQVQAGEIVPVYDDLGFHLSRIQVGNQLFAADMTYQGGDIFHIHNLMESADASSGYTSFKSEHFSGSGVCEQCHNDLEDEAGNDVSIVSAWETTMMANAAKDPFWLAKVRSELNRTPKLRDVINDTCTRCHAPMANEEARKQKDPVQSIFDQGILSKENRYHDLAMNGVSCSLCHQISPKGDFGTEAGFSGNFAIESFDKKSDRLIYGPFQNVLMTPMQNFASFTPVWGAHIQSSKHCASCHELTTPYTDENGTVLSTGKEDEFPEQAPYSEWLHSDFSEFGSCQKCHMERSSGVIIASQPPTLDTKRDGFAQHSFLGSNRLMLKILQDNREALGVIPEDFSISLSNASKLLRAAATLTIENPVLQENSLTFAVDINSETGHKLPTGYPSRRVILHVKIWDEQDNIVFESGKFNKDGSIVELDSDLDPNKYEPHYELIESEKQVQVYETIMHDYKDNITFTLLRAKSYLKDNRLLPNGFDKHSAVDKIKVHGKALADEDFIGGGDKVQFKIADLTADKYTIQAELVYQTLGYAFAQDLFKDQAKEISQFKQMFNASKLKSAVTDRVKVAVER